MTSTAENTIEAGLEKASTKFKRFPAPEAIIAEYGTTPNTRWYNSTHGDISADLKAVTEYISGNNKRDDDFISKQKDLLLEILKQKDPNENPTSSMIKKITEIARSLSKEERKPDEEDAHALLSTIEYRLELLEELVISFSPFAYEPDHIASLWFDQDSHTINGRSVDSALKPVILIHLAIWGGYDFIEMIKANWSSCDDFRNLRKYYRREFINSGMKAADHLETSDKDWFNGLEDDIIIYRGSQSVNQQGLSWTTDREVAKKFALHSRGLAHDEPQITTGKINKDHVFYATNSRNEYELVVDYKKVEEMDVEFLTPGS